MKDKMIQLVSVDSFKSLVTVKTLIKSNGGKEWLGLETGEP